jgi:hypothetical protein
LAGLLLAALLCLPAGLTLAASDGYYCAGPGYLAYQFNGTAAPNGGQILSLYRLDPDKGLGGPRRFPLEPFQVHGMRCLDDRVDLLAWDRIYRLQLTDQQPPRIDQIEPQPEDSLFPDFTSDNLGPWATASQTIPLETAAGRFSFELVIERRTIPASDRGPEATGYRVKSFLRQKDATGTVLDQEIFSGRSKTPVD